MARPLVKPGSEDGKKWERLYQKHCKALYIVALKTLKNKDDAADAVQTTFLKVSQNLNRIDESDERRTFNYLLSILKNLIIDKYRHNAKEERALSKMQSAQSRSEGAIDVENSVIAKLRLEEIIGFVRQMDDQQATAFLLHYLNDVSIQELSELTGKSREQLYEIVRSVRNKIKKHIREEEQGK